MERLTERSPRNNMAYLMKVKSTEQVVECQYPNTLRCITEAFERLAAYEDTGLSPDEIQGREDYIAGVEAIIQKFRKRMEQINNIAVGWSEDGPYEDANTKALEKMMEIQKLSRLPQPPKEEK